MAQSSSNTNLKIDHITNESLMVLENSLTFAKCVTRDYDDQYSIDGAKRGDTVRIRKPVKYVGTAAQEATIEDSVETKVDLQLSTQFHVAFEFGSKELTLDIDRFSDRYIKPACAVLANKIDRDGMALYKKVYASVGIPGLIPDELLTYLNAGAVLDEMACPNEGKRCSVVAPRMQVELVDQLGGRFQDATSIADQYKRGTMGIAGGFKFSMDQNVNIHTTGNYGGTLLVNTGSQTGATLSMNGCDSDSGTFLDGDVFTMAGVFAVNPQSRASTGQLQQFVVTADTNASGGAAATLPISPSITTSGKFQTVTASPANDAAITMLGAANTATPQGLAFHPNAFALAMAPLRVPKNVEMAGMKSHKGFSIRFVSDYNVKDDAFVTRIDVLFGWAVLYAENACRVHS